MAGRDKQDRHSRPEIVSDPRAIPNCHRNRGVSLGDNKSKQPAYDKVIVVRVNTNKAKVITRQNQVQSAQPSPTQSRYHISSTNKLRGFTVSSPRKASGNGGRHAKGPISDRALEAQA